MTTQNKLKKRRSQRAKTNMSLYILGISLTERQKRACERYLVHFNQTRAYKEAGYAYANDNVAGVASHKLFKKPYIRKYLGYLVKKITKKNELEAEQILQQLVALSSSNILDYANWTEESVSVTPSEKMTREQAFCIHKLTIRHDKQNNAIINLELYNKYTALNMLAQYFQLLKPVEDEETEQEKAFRLRDSLEKMFKSVPFAPPSNKKQKLPKSVKAQTRTIKKRRNKN